MSGAQNPLVDHRATVSWLADHDALCPICDYALRGLTTPVCPECGAALRLTIASDRTRTGAWALALVAPAIALGFDAVVPVVMASAWVAFGGTPGWEAWLVFRALIGLALASGAALCGLAVFRRRWLRLARGTQWRLALLVWAFVGVVHGAVGAWLAGELI